MSITKHLAHITILNGCRYEQTVEEHSRHVAEYAGESLRKVDLYNTGYLTGLIHDFGKGTSLFLDYIERTYRGEQTHRGEVNHTFAGVRFLMERYYKENNEKYQLITCEIIAAASGSHHGLFDIDNPTKVDHVNGFDHRIDKGAAINYSEAKNSFLTEVAKENEIDELFEKAYKEIKGVIIKAGSRYDKKSSEALGLVLGYLVRLILSAVIEGDRRDTAEFMRGKKQNQLQADRRLWQRNLKFYEDKINKFKSDTPINKVRSEISEQCRITAKREGGIYRLTVPTGGGKTLASLRFALSHAAEYEKSRIIFIIPLLSVLDQNSKEIKEYIEDDGLVLEHHSNVIDFEENSTELDKRELLTETWDSPIIISTLVQLLNVLFSHKTQAIRRMNSLCNSVIIIDEVQSVPCEFMQLFAMALNFLAESCGVTIVLCSATQPAFEKLGLALHLAENPEMVKIDDKMASVFNRVTIKNKMGNYGMSADELSAFAIDYIEDHDSLLIICNTKSTARNLFEKIKLANLRDCYIYYLSTAMCKCHRHEVLEKIGKVPGLGENKKVICVSTQLVEAGIDFSFEGVIRALAGIDSIIQAAGRCNRNNDWGKLCETFIVKIQEERLGSLRSIKEARVCCEEVIYDFEQRPEKYDSNYMSKAFIDKYYEVFQNNTYFKKQLNYPVDINGCQYYILQLLSSINNEYHYILKQAFKTAGKNCKVFKDEKTDIVVKRDDKVNGYIANLFSEKASHDYTYAKKQLELMKPYTISIYHNELSKLRQDCKIDETSYEGVIFLDKSAYNEKLGLCTDGFVEGNDFMNI